VAKAAARFTWLFSLFFGYDTIRIAHVTARFWLFYGFIDIISMENECERMSVNENAW